MSKSGSVECRSTSSASGDPAAKWNNYWGCWWSVCWHKVRCMDESQPIHPIIWNKQEIYFRLAIVNLGTQVWLLPSGIQISRKSMGVNDGYLLTQHQKYVTNWSTNLQNNNTDSGASGVHSYWGNSGNRNVDTEADIFITSVSSLILSHKQIHWGRAFLCLPIENQCKLYFASKIRH